MKWISKLFSGEDTQSPVAVATGPTLTGDTLLELQQQNNALILDINAHSGMLPNIGVVLARRITDLAATILREAEGSSISINARVALHGILSDYLPGSIRTYLAAARAGRPDETALSEQLDLILAESEALLSAQRGQDMQAMEVHSVFLKTKFTRSDLSL